MDHRPTWAQALDISQAQLTSWTAQAPEGQPVLFYCLEQGLIASAAYYQWAREHFGLATLDSGFFTEACDLELVRGARELESYKPWFFPVARWDDVIYVACIEPVDEMPPGYCLVLAEATAMQTTWNSAASDEMTLNAPEVEERGEGFVDVPQGFASGEVKSFQLNLDGLSMSTEEYHEPAPAPKLQVAPEPEHHQAEDEVVIPAAPAAQFAPKLQVAPPLAHEVEAETGVGIDLKMEGEPDAEEVPAVTSTLTGLLSDDLDLNLPNAEAGALTRTFDYLNQMFSNACVLRCTESMIRLHKYSLGMKPANQGVALDLSYPSFLRIVARTQQAYHGYLIDSPTHREFFRGLGIEGLPGSVSAVPLVFDEQLWGVLMVTGSAEQQNVAALKPVENAARQLTTALAGVWKKSA